jgi:hypothetical protein
MNLAPPSVSALDSETLARHRWYFFKEAFSPDIVDHAIANASLGDASVVFDPFSGSGTTPVTAAIRGFRGVGIEVNPFLQFVSETKARLGTSSSFKVAIDKALTGAMKGADSPLEHFSTFSSAAPKAKKRGKWLFNKPVLRSFQGAWESSSRFAKPERSFVRLCLIGAALDAANAAKDGKCLRYKSGWESLKLGRNDFINALNSRAKIISEDLDKESDLQLNVKITLGDSRRFGEMDSFDLCVTSPPYLNSFDYTDVYRPELFLGGFVGSMEQLRRLRLATVRSHVQTKWSDPKQNDFGKNYTESLSRLESAAENLEIDNGRLWNQRIPLMIQAYFEDMKLVLKRLKKRAKPHASVWLVVSTSSYAGVEIPVDLIIADIAVKSGWFLREVQVMRHLRRVAGQQWHELNDRGHPNGPHLRESLVVLDAVPRRS